MRLHARFRPDPRGAGGTATLVGSDGVGPSPAWVASSAAVPQRLTQIALSAASCKGLLAGDLVALEVRVHAHGIAHGEPRVLARPCRVVTGEIEGDDATFALRPDRQVATAPLPLSAALSRTGPAAGMVLTVLTSAPPDPLTARARIAGPYPAGSVAAVRARAVGGSFAPAVPTLTGEGPRTVGLDPVAADLAHTRLAGQLAAGEGGVADGLTRDGPVPGVGLERAERSDEPCVTIDGLASRDLDDAVGARWNGAADGPVEVAVHVTDVAAHVGLESPADHHARTVGAAAYLAGIHAPMLAADLALAAGSLGVGQPRDVLTVRFPVAPDGRIGPAHLEAARIVSRARLSPSAVESWLDGDAGQLQVQARTQAALAAGVLSAVSEAARRLRGAPERAAALERLFTPARLRPALVDGAPLAVPARPHARAADLVERLMVAANTAVAHWLAERAVPALYRAHDGLDPGQRRRVTAAARRVGLDLPAEPAARLAALLNALDDLAPPNRAHLAAAAAAAVTRARTGSSPAPHRGLGAACYTQFTSPLRRYTDLWLHRQIRSVLAGEPAPRAAPHLDTLGRWLDARAGTLARTEAAERDGLWRLLLDSGAVGREEPAVIVDVRRSGLRARLERLGFAVWLQADRLPGPGGTLDVRDHGLASTDGAWRVGDPLILDYEPGHRRRHTRWHLRER